MDFYAVLARVIEILQREGRTSYRALKRQFALDDEYLADLKVELIEVKQLAVDQDGTMLVWTGAATSQRATQDAPWRRLRPSQPHRRLRRPNAGSSPCCSVIWWTRRAWRASSTRKSCARWCRPIKPPAPK